MATAIKRRELFSSFAGIGASPAGARVCTGADLIPNVKLRTHEGDEVSGPVPPMCRSAARTGSVLRKGTRPEVGCGAPHGCISCSTVTRSYPAFW